MEDDTFAKMIYAMLLLALLGLVTAIGYLVEDDAAACRAATTLGMHECHVGTVHQIMPGLYGCGHDDIIGYEISATTAAGQTTNATVCCGAFKNCTLRTQ